MKLRRFPTVFFSLGICLVIALGLIACGGSSDSGGSGGGSSKGLPEQGDAAAANDTSGTGGTLRIAMTAGNIPIPDQFLTEGGEGRRFVGQNIYDQLIMYNAGQGEKVPDLRPGLATSWEVASDNLTWTFKLRQGVKFTDGTPFNADAVVFAFDRIINKEHPFFSESQRSAGLSNFVEVASYKKIDDFTFQVVTRRPWAFLTYDMGAINIPSPTAVQKWGNKDYISHPVGTGPFTVAKYIDGQVMELVPNKDYWDTANRPKLDRLILFPMPDPATRLAALQSGQVDWAEVVPPDSIKQLKAEGYNVLLKSYPHIITVMLNNTKAPLDDIRVRQALNYGTDRDGTVALISGAGMPATQEMYEGHPWYDPSFAGYKYDPEKAKKLLAEAGHPNGFKMTMAFPTSGSGNMYPGPMTEKFQQDMKAIGVDVTLVPLEWLNILTIYRAGLQTPENRKYDALYFSPNTQTPLFLFGAYLSARIPPAGCCNPMGFNNPEVDKLFNQAAASFDVEKQTELLLKTQGALIREAPGVVWVHDLNLRVLTSKVRGWQQPQSWWGDFTRVWMKP
jgi:peptide/nickel transport system substrate-binding protein